ncbi:diphosphomevalonate decarboxylase [Lentilactobacillus sp. Marseille-Q4993]|uniref:diphosphomevalonate decarboxylase n=1 Tax=Lentilactobacillus sp. Marseille-Q4993 TaxID=3039492 RepID=UPI0024BBF79D|nr:diphosphomevalonate decarboxylase [Lentilactobacillus sp. Marseille-Q4993]
MTMLSNNSATARAHTNIALVKYWGKKDDKLILPYTGSLSLTLDKFYTETTVTFNEQLTNDEFYLNSQVQDSAATKKVSRFIDIVRNMAGESRFAKVQSTNHVPTAAGFASSASAMAALAGATSKAAGLALTPTELSILARKGSGSACRSIFGGFVEWLPGVDDHSSHAVQVDDANLTDINVIALTVNANQKKVSSRQEMKTTVDTSPFYNEWPQIVSRDLTDIKLAIKDDDFTRFGQISESNALKMHALTMGATPPFTYFEPKTIEIMNQVNQLRTNGIECYFTIDAGPNVKILSRSNNVTKIAAAFTDLIGAANINVAKAGPGIEIL